jgi:hypothetical protein
LTVTYDGLAVASNPVPAAYAQPGKQPQGLSLGVQGYQKQGKSSLGDTGPRPTLILDVETASFWTPSRKVYWDFKRETCPAWPADQRAARAGNPDGLWDTCIVIIHDYHDLYKLLEFLVKGLHPFNSVSMDSVTEIQQRIMWQLAGSGKMQQDDWGTLLRHVNGIIRGYRDLITHPTNKIWSVVYIMGTHFDKRMGKFRPLVQGSSQDYLPYVPDALGWLEAGPDGSRWLHIGPSPLYETGDRLWGRLPWDMQIGYPGMVPGWTLESMVTHLLTTQ